MDSSDTTIYLEVNAGLCNRIRALISGICWAQGLNRDLVVYWPSFKPECIAGFYDLFDKFSLPPDVQVIDDVLSEKTTCLSPGDGERLILRVPPDRPIRIISHGCFYNLNQDIWDFHLQNLQPSAAVKAKITEWNEQGLSELDTAIHIRRTDNHRAIELSPFELFIQKIIERPDERFALFTDDSMSASFLKHKFGDRILTFESIRNRVSKEGMIEATAVFFSLASRKRILGSAYSSFSEIASQYGDNTLETVKIP
jgi:hypothetical protein